MLRRRRRSQHLFPPVISSQNIRLITSAKVQKVSIPTKKHFFSCIVFYCCPGKSTEPKVDDSQGAKDHRRGCSPPAPDRREEPPGRVSLTIISPEGATEYVTCLISTCLWLCRPLTIVDLWFGAFSVVATLPGVVTPVCGLSSLRDFWQAPISCYSSETPMREDLKGRERNFPRTAIIVFFLFRAGL